MQISYFSIMKSFVHIFCDEYFYYFHLVLWPNVTDIDNQIDYLTRYMKEKENSNKTKFFIMCTHMFIKMVEKMKILWKNSVSWGK